MTTLTKLLMTAMTATHALRKHGEPRLAGALQDAVTDVIEELVQAAQGTTDINVIALDGDEIQEIA